jgi:hypothetical protein
MAKDRRFPIKVELWVSEEIHDGLQAATASYNGLLSLSDIGRIGWQDWLSRCGYLPRPQTAQSQPQAVQAQPFPPSPFAQAPINGAPQNGR